MIRLYSIVAAGLVAGLLGVMGWMIWSGRQASGQFAQCLGSNIAGGAGALGGAFELIDQNGATVTDATLITRPTLLYFGYTFCPDICPIDAARNAEALEILEENGQIAQTVFVSVDPRRDTPEVLSEFSSIFHPRMTGVTGSEAQLRAAAQAYRAYFSVPANPTDEFYLVDHTSYTYLVLPGHGVVDVFNRALTGPQLAERAGCFIENS